jgi:hypothetical protein
MRPTAHLPAALVALAAVAAPAIAHAEDTAPRSPEIATLAALVPVGASIALGGAALATDSEALGWAAVTTFVVGPSAGHFYANAPGRGFLTMAARAGGVGTFAVGGLLYAFADWDEDDNDNDEASSGARRDGALLMAVGATAAIAATAYDVLDAAPAVRRFNAEIMVAPTLVNGAAGNAPGMAISGRF